MFSIFSFFIGSQKDVLLPFLSSEEEKDEDENLAGHAETDSMSSLFSPLRIPVGFSPLARRLPTDFVSSESEENETYGEKVTYLR